jgi:RHS repeat-associated protein
LEAARASCQQNDWERRQHLACNDASKDIILYYQCDHLGTPLQLLDENGKIYWSARYRVWGEILQYYATDVLQPLRFQGQYYDQETGLYYTRHRYFDPVTGRFVSQDPIGLLGGENQYQYGPNPTGWIDPLGLQRKNKKSAPERKEGNPNSAETSPCKNFVRVRHYTGVSRAKAIITNGVIQPGEHNRVYLELASSKPLSAQKVADKYRIPIERGKAYVETDVCEDKIEWKANPLYGSKEATVKGPITLRKPTITIQN